MSSTARIAAWFLCAIALLVAACRGGEEERAPTSYVELLRFVPDQTAYRGRIMVMDYAALRQLPAATDLEDDATPLAALALASRQYAGFGLVEPLGVQAAPHWPEIVENWTLGFGFTIDDIDRSLVASSFDDPSANLGVIAGRFEPDAVAARLAACARCAPPTVSEYLDQRYYSWREGISLEPEERFQPPVFDNLGRGGHIALTEDHVVFDLVWAPFRDALDARQRGGSVVDDEAFRLIAEQLDEAPPLVVLISDRTQGPERQDEMRREFDEPQLTTPFVSWSRAQLESAGSEVLLLPYEAFAVAAHWEDGQPTMSVILAHQSAEDATTNVVRLPERLNDTTTWMLVDEDGNGVGIPWSERFSSWEVRADGQIVTAELQGMPHWPAFLFGSDTLLFHE